MAVEIATPAKSVTLVEIVKVYCVLELSALLGINFAILPIESYLTLPVTELDPDAKVIFCAVMVVGSIGSENPISIPAIPTSTAGVLSVIPSLLFG